MSLWLGDLTDNGATDSKVVVAALIRGAFGHGETREERLDYVRTLVERRTRDLSRVGTEVLAVTDVDKARCLPLATYETLQRVDGFTTVEEALCAYVPSPLWDMVGARCRFFSLTWFFLATLASFEVANSG